MDTLGIIPARFESTRFPGKPLIEIDGKSMIHRVYDQACHCKGLDCVVVATDDDRIFQHVNRFGGRVVMTSDLHKSGTDRCAEVVQLTDYEHFQLAVNIQGDEPFIHPEQISQVISILKNGDFHISTLAKKYISKEDFLDKNKVKIVMDSVGKALYFSRSPIPYFSNAGQGEYLEKEFLKHIGIYGFRRDTLLKLHLLPQSNLEIAESLEQLRWLENGYAIGVGITEFESIGIDTPDDLNKLNIGFRRK